jgi:hypothetical protein
MTLPVKYYDNTMEGAPQLTNAWGCMTGLLDAVLVTGFNVKTIATLTSTGGVATASITAGHGYRVGQCITVAGANESAYNGEFLVTSVTSNNVLYAITGTPASPATTGSSLTVKTSPLGWEAAYTGTTKRAYRSTNVLSNKPVLRVDDTKDAVYTTTYSKYAKVTMAQGMSDIDTFVGLRAPYDPLLPTKNEVGTGSGGSAYGGWFKWYYAKKDGGTSYGVSDSTVPAELNRLWYIIGDDRGFYIFNQWDNQIPSLLGAMGGHCFTDFESYRSADSFNTLLCATDAYITANSVLGSQGPDCQQQFVKSNDYIGKTLLADHTQIGNPIRAGFASLNTNNTVIVSGQNTGINWPNGPDYSLILHPVYLRQENGHLRGKMPGMMHIFNNNPALETGTIITGVSGYPGRKFLIVKAHTVEGGGTTMGMVAFDVTGPWW